MGRGTDIYRAAIAMSDLDENEATDSEFLAELYEQAERRVRSAETTLERRNRSAQAEVTNRIKERRELYTDLADIRSNEKKNALDNITKLKVSFQAQQGAVFKRRIDAGRTYIERAKYQQHVGPQGKLKALTKSISAPGDVPAGSRVSDFEFGDFWHSVMHDPAFGLSEDSQGNLVFPAGMTDSVAKAQLKDMHERAKRVDKSREAASKSIAEQVAKLDTLKRKLEGTSGDRLNDQELNEVNKELKDATKNVRDELDAEDRKVGGRARKDLDDYLEDDEVYQSITAKIGLLEASQKKSLPITSENFLEWARARGMRVGQIAADGLYIPGRDDNAALAAWYVEMKRGVRSDGTARYIGGNPRTGEIVTLQYFSDDIERVRADDGQIYMREDGTVINPSEIHAMRSEPIRGVMYSHNLGEEEYAMMIDPDGTVHVYSPDGEIDTTTEEGRALKEKVQQQRGDLLYAKDESGDLKYADKSDYDARRELFYKTDVVEQAETNPDLTDQLAVLDPSRRVPEGAVAMNETQLEKRFTVTETAFVLHPNALDAFNNPGKTRYRLMDGTEIVRDDGEFISKETAGNVGKNNATVGEVARHLNDERLIRAAERRMSRSGDPRGWFQKVVDGSVLRKKDRVDPGGEQRADPGELEADKAYDIATAGTEADVISKTFHYAGAGGEGVHTTAEIDEFRRQYPDGKHYVWKDEEGFGDDWKDVTEVEDFGEVVDLSIPDMEASREPTPEPVPEEAPEVEEVVEEETPAAAPEVEEEAEAEEGADPTRIDFSDDPGYINVAPETDTGAAGLVETLAGDASQPETPEAEAVEVETKGRKKLRGPKDPDDIRRLAAQEAARRRIAEREAQPEQPEAVDPMAPAFTKETIKGILDAREIDLMSFPELARKRVIDGLRDEFEADPKAFQKEADRKIWGPPKEPQSALEMLAETGSTTPPEWKVLEEGPAEPEELAWGTGPDALNWGTGPDPKPAKKKKKTARQRLEEFRQRRAAKESEDDEEVAVVDAAAGS